MLIAHYTHDINIPLVVLNDDFDMHDGRVLVRSLLSPGVDPLWIDRFLVTVPVESCILCAKPLVLEEKNGKGMAKCPDFAKHALQQCRQAAIDPKLTRTQRRKAHQQAVRWAREWMALCKARDEKATEQGRKFASHFAKAVELLDGVNSQPA